MYVLFYIGHLSHYPSCLCAGVTNLNEPRSSFLLPPHYCGLGAGAIPFRAIANKQCEMRGLFMSLVIHYWIGDIQDCQGVSASEMTYIVSSGALNSTHSLSLWCGQTAAVVKTELLRWACHCWSWWVPFTTITHKFLESGHSFLPDDSDFGDMRSDWNIIPRYMSRNIGTI